MKEFKIGDSFICYPGNQTCLLKITKIGEFDEERKCKVIEYQKYTYVNDTYDDDKYETGEALIFRDEDKGKEYVQLDQWLTRKYCIRHVVYCG